MKAFVCVLALLSAAQAAPQFLTFAHTNPTVATTSTSEQQLGLSRISSHAKTVEDGTSSVSRHSTHVSNPQTFVTRTRPVAVTQRIAGLPRTTTTLVNSPVAIAAQPLNTFAGRTFIQGLDNEQSVFQAADGRFFALADNLNNARAGQIFQSNGRLFTFGSTNAFNVNEDSFAVADAARVAGARLNAKEEEEEEEEEIVEIEEEEEEEVEEEDSVLARANNNGNARTFSRTTITAPLTTSNARFIGASPFAAVRTIAQPAFHTVAAQPAAIRTIAQPAAVRTIAQPAFHTVAAAPTLVRTVPQTHTTVAAAPAVVRSTNLGYSFADTASQGFFVSGNDGIAYEF